MSLQALSDYTVISRYAKYLPNEKRRETWSEMTDRVFEMHRKKYANQVSESSELKELFNFAQEYVKKKRVLGAQRLLQFGGDPIFKHPSKTFNCSYGYIDREMAFGEAMYLLLCGCGVGFSVQRKHINKLSDIRSRTNGKKVFVAEDSIEGWADCVQVLMDSYFVRAGKFKEYGGYEVEFDLSNIRPEGALIAGQFKAPGPKGLENSLRKIQVLIDNRLSNNELRLRPIDAYDICMHFSDAVLSGGVRRSATICLFSKDDEEMMNAKTEDWFLKNPQRGRSNNSALLVRDDVTKEEFTKLMESTKNYGEPGFVFTNSEDIGYNPCVRGDTKIPVKSKGWVRIDSVINQEVETWNGFEWSKVTPRITGYNQQMLKVTLNNGQYLYCTKNHKWLISRSSYENPDEFQIVEAQNLKIGDPIAFFTGPAQPLIESVEEAGIDEKVYCFTEPRRNFGTFNGIVTGQCVEISLYPQTQDGRSGWQMCNLTEINGKYCDSEEKFYECCKASAIIGTLQAGYTNFKYLSKESQEITEREALLGCSITGIMDNPKILLDPEVQKKGALIVKEVNKIVAKLLGINPAARTTCIKPAGSTSCVLSSSSGIHPHHAKRYIRRVQANRNEFPVQYFKKINPLAVEKSVWSNNGTDEVISFLCEVPKGAITKNSLSAVQLLEKVKLTQQNWVEVGTNIQHCVNKAARHNVSNTITVKDSEWEEVTDFLYENRNYFSGVSLLPASGDLDYPQAPFTSILDEDELVKEYGPGSLLASGLIVDGLAAFNNNLWSACDAVNGIGNKLPDLIEPQEPIKPNRKAFKTEKEYSSALTDYAINLSIFYNEKGEYVVNRNKNDWIRRANQFAIRYFDGNVKKMCHCLKHVYSFKLWLDLKREYKEIDWSTVIEDDENFVNADTLAAQGCAGGKCEI